jgi:hypothetical protein
VPGTPVGLGTNSVFNTGNTVVITLGTAVIVGDFVIVGAGGSANGVVTGVTDSKGNTYAVDKTDATLRGNGLASSKIATALAIGDTITVTFTTSASSRRHAWALSDSNLDPATWLDKTNAASGTTAAWNGGATGALAQADEIVVANGFLATTGTTTPATNYTELYDFGDAGSTISGVYRIVAATTSETPGGTWSVSGSQWDAVTASYKGAGGGTTLGSLIPQPLLMTLRHLLQFGPMLRGYTAPADATAAVTTPVSASIDLPIEATQGIAQILAVPVTATQDVATTSPTFIEATQPLSTTAAEPIEAAQGVATTTGSPLDATGAVSTTAAEPVETQQPASTTASAPIDATQGVAPTSASAPVEATGGVRTTASEPLDTTQGISTTTSEPVEATQGVTPATATSFVEALRGIVLSLLEPVESAQGVATTASAPIEALQGIAQTGQEPLDAQGAAVTPVATTALLPVEALQALAAATGAQLEALAGILAAPVLPLEALQRAAQTLALPLEALQPVAASALAPVDAGSDVTQTATTPLDARGGVTQTAGLPLDTVSEFVQTIPTNARIRYFVSPSAYLRSFPSTKADIRADAI